MCKENYNFITCCTSMNYEYKLVITKLPALQFITVSLKHTHKQKGVPELNPWGTSDLKLLYGKK